MSVHVVSSIETPDFGGMTLRIGDLDGDGAPDLLLTQSEFGSREIRCLTMKPAAMLRRWWPTSLSLDMSKTWSILPLWNL